MKMLSMNDLVKLGESKGRPHLRKMWDKLYDEMKKIKKFKVPKNATPEEKKSNDKGWVSINIYMSRVMKSIDKVAKLEKDMYGVSKYFPMVTTNYTWRFTNELPRLGKELKELKSLLKERKNKLPSEVYKKSKNSSSDIYNIRLLEKGIDALEKVIKETKAAPERYPAGYKKK